VERLHADVLWHLCAIERATMAAGVAPREDGEGIRGEVGEGVLAGGHGASVSLPAKPLPS